jgi:hypothetical protein
MADQAFRLRGLLSVATSEVARFRSRVCSLRRFEALAKRDHNIHDFARGFLQLGSLCSGLRNLFRGNQRLELLPVAIGEFLGLEGALTTRRQIFLPETRAGAAAGMDFRLRDFASVGRCRPA